MIAEAASKEASSEATPATEATTQVSEIQETTPVMADPNQQHGRCIMARLYLIYLRIDWKRDLLLLHAFFLVPQYFGLGDPDLLIPFQLMRNTCHWVPYKFHQACFHSFFFLMILVRNPYLVNIFSLINDGSRYQLKNYGNLPLLLCTYNITVRYNKSFKQIYIFYSWTSSRCSGYTASTSCHTSCHTSCGTNGTPSGTSASYSSDPK